MEKAELFKQNMLLIIQTTTINRNILTNLTIRLIEYIIKSSNETTNAPQGKGEKLKMYLISANDLYTVVCLIHRLPDRYIKNGDHYDGVYNELTRAELKAICSRGIKV